LQIIFRHYPVALQLGITGQVFEFFEHLGGIAARTTVYARFITALSIAVAVAVSLWPVATPTPAARLTIIQQNIGSLDLGVCPNSPASEMPLSSADHKFIRCNIPNASKNAGISMSCQERDIMVLCPAQRTSSTSFTHAPSTSAVNAKQKRGGPLRTASFPKLQSGDADVRRGIQNSLT
jgi:hypothetical protein